MTYNCARFSRQREEKLLQKRLQSEEQEEEQEEKQQEEQETLVAGSHTSHKAPALHNYFLKWYIDRNLAEIASNMK